MPYTGTGTGIQNADDVFFSNISDTQVLRFDSANAKWINTALSVVTSELANDAVTEPKLAIANSPSTNQVLSWDGSALRWATPTATPADATTSAKGIVQLAGDLAGTASAPTVPGLANKAALSQTHPQSEITGLTTALAGKEGTVTAGTTAQYYRGDKTWQALDKASVGLSNVDNTSDANKPVSTATQTALGTKADQSVTISGTSSLTGGGTLAANRTLSLVGDAASPGNSRYYGTNATGTKGYYTIPSGDPTLGGDLTGTASNAQIAANAVGATELASNAVTEPKLSVANSPATGQVLSWNGSAMSWAGALAFAFTRVDVTSNYTVTNSFEYVFADATAVGITVTLPAPMNNGYVRVKRISSGANGVLIVPPNGSVLDGSGVGSDVLSSQWDSQEYWSDGSNWYR